MTKARASTPTGSLGALPQLNELRYFCAVYEQGSFTAAARELHMSQPPISHAIQALERRWGVHLFARSSRKVQPTAIADALYPEVLDVLQRFSSLGLRAQRAAENRAGVPLRLGAITSAFGSLIPELVRRCDGFDLSVTDLASARIVDDVREGRLDVGIVREVNADLVQTVELLDEQLYAAVPDDHPLAGAGECTLTELAEHPMVVFDRTLAPLAYDAIMTGFRLAHVTVTPVAHVSSEHAAIALVRGGLGVAVVPGIAQGDPVDGVRFIPIRDSGITYPLYLVVPDGDPRSLAHEFGALVRDAITCITRHPLTQKENTTS